MLGANQPSGKSILLQCGIGAVGGGPPVVVDAGTSWKMAMEREVRSLYRLQIEWLLGPRSLYLLRPRSLLLFGVSTLDCRLLGPWRMDVSLLGPRRIDLFLANKSKKDSLGLGDSTAHKKGKEAGR